MWPLFGLVLMVLLAMGSVVFNDFTTWDDPHTISENPAFNPPKWDKILAYWNPGRPAASLWVPITYTVWGGLAELAYLQQADDLGVRLNPAVFHGASLLLHLISTILVFGLVYRATTALAESASPLVGSSRPWLAAWAGAALFGCHPLQVEAVAWASGLKDLLSCVGCLGAVTCFAVSLGSSRDTAAGPDGNPPTWRRIWWWLGLILFVLGTLSKPSSMTTPALAFAYGWLGLRQPLWRVARAVWPWFLWVPVVVVWTKIAQPGTGVETAPIYLRPLVALDALAFYMGKLICPFVAYSPSAGSFQLLPLTYDYSRRPMLVIQSGAVWWTWILPVALAWLLWRYRKAAGLAVLGGIWAVIALSPVLGLTPFVFQYFTTTADHYVYPAMVGAAFGLALLVLHLGSQRISPGTRQAAKVAVSAFLGLCVLGSVFQMQVWRDSQSLYNHAIKVNPKSFSAYLNLGSIQLTKAGRTEDAPTRYRHASAALEYFDQAVQARPEFSLSWDSRASALFMLFRWNEGVESLEKALALSEALPPTLRRSTLHARMTMADVMLKKGRAAKAVEYLETASRLAEVEGPPESVKDDIRTRLQAARAAAATQPSTQGSQP